MTKQISITRPKCVGYSQHDAESIYKCPKCGREYGSWDFLLCDGVIACKCRTILAIKGGKLKNDKTDINNN